MKEQRILDAALLRGMGAVAIFAAVAGAARVGQDVAIAWRFGTGPAVDAYYFVVNLANWPVAVALGALTWMLAPVDAALRDEAAKLRFRAELLGSALCVAAVSLPLAWWAMHAIAGGPLGGLERSAALYATQGVAELAAAVPLGLLGALLSAWFVAGSRHVLALLEALPPLVLVALVLLVPGTVLFWGTSAGIALQVLAMALLMRQRGELPMPALGFSADAWRGFRQGAAAMLFGQAVFALVPLVDAFLAARLGDGTVAALSYANRLVLGIQGLAGLALQRSALPLLSALTADAPSQSRYAALRWAVVAAGMGAVLGLVVAWLADPLVSLLFERGSFTAADGEQVATLIRYSMLQMPVFLAGMAMVTALASVQATKAFAVAAVAGLAVKILMSVVLVSLLGVAGLPLATALMYGMTAWISWLALRAHLRRRAS